jgi:prophage regulatory protein
LQARWFSAKSLAHIIGPSLPKMGQMSKTPANIPVLASSSAHALLTLPAVGLFKWPRIAPFLPVGRETWRKLVVAGKAPQPIRYSKTCVVYRAQDIHAWLADPVGYRADPAEKAA